MYDQDVATSIVKKLTDSGFKAYFAGGWVRDFLMGHPSSDIDIATDAPPEQILSLFPHTIPVGIAFGVIIVVEEGRHFEVSTFRRDVNYTNGRSPEKIELASPEEDASRRDFTINGMFYDPLTHEIYDYVGGKEDLKKKVIRTIGIPYQRFEEDRLRLIRAVRFASRFGFDIDLETKNAIQAYSTTLFPSVAIERVWQELLKMSEYPRFDQALIEMHRLGLLQVIFPALSAIPTEMIEKRVSAFSCYPKDCPTILYIMSLFPESSLPTWLKIGRYLKVRNQDLALIEFFWKANQLLKHEENQVELAEWAHFYANSYSELCVDVFLAGHNPEEKEQSLHQHRHRKHLLSHDINRIVQKTPLVTAANLQAQGISPGKSMGILLREAEKIAINQRHQHYEDVIRALKSTPEWPVLS